MWSRFEKLKDNITQIASDVLDSQDEDLDALQGYHNGAPDDAEDASSPRELGYYTEPHVDAATMKYAGLLEEKETVVSILREENRVLKEQFL